MSSKLMIACIFCLSAGPLQAERDQTQPPAELLKAYTSCSEDAGHRKMSRNEISVCSDIYLRLKLSFLRDVDYARFVTLPAAERAEASAAGYRSWHAWQHSSVLPAPRPATPPREAAADPEPPNTTRSGSTLSRTFD